MAPYTLTAVMDPESGSGHPRRRQPRCRAQLFHVRVTNGSMLTKAESHCYDDYAAQRAAGQAHAGPSSLEITESTSITFGINEILEVYYNDHSFKRVFRWNRLLWLFSGARASAVLPKITLQISDDGVFDETHLRNDLPDWYDITMNDDVISNALLFEDGVEREIEYDWDLNAVGRSVRKQRKIHRTVLSICGYSLSSIPTRPFVLDNFSVTQQPPIPEPAHYALCAGSLALLALIARRRRGRH